MIFGIRCLLGHNFRALGRYIRPSIFSVTNHRRLARCPTIKYFSVSTHLYCSHQSINDCSESPETDEFEYKGSSPYANIDHDRICEGDPNKVKQLQLLQLEIDLLNHNGENIPSNLNTIQWITLLGIRTKSGRFRYLRSLWIIEMKKSEKLRKQKLYQERITAKRRAEAKRGPLVITTSGPLKYDLTYNSLLQRIYPQRIDKFFNLQLLKACMFNPPFLVDCGYCSLMDSKSLVKCALQLQRAWSQNRLHNNPHHLIFCNLDSRSELMQKLHAVFHGVHEPGFPFFHTSKSYLDLYSRERLVYLTPDAKRDLVQYNPNDIYIVGGLVDVHHDQPLALAKAKKDNVRTARFPIKQYLNWGYGSKSLDVNTAVCIMNDLNHYRKWQIAFRNIPPSKQKSWKTATMEKMEEQETKVPLATEIEQRSQNQLYDLLLKDRYKFKNKDK